MAKTWKQRALAATRGSQLGAIVACVLGRKIPAPHFIGKASITSDGFVMCDFRSKDGAYRHGAFVCDATDLERNTAGLIAHLELTPEEQKIFLAAMSAWISTDYRNIADAI